MAGTVRLTLAQVIDLLVLFGLGPLLQNRLPHRSHLFNEGCFGRIGGCALYIFDDVEKGLQVLLEMGMGCEALLECSGRHGISLFRRYRT